MNNEVMFSSNSMEWSTPQDFFNKLNEEFHFDLDPCCTDENAKCEFHYTLSTNGLEQNWGGRRVFCNPPYGKEIKKWVRKCYEESLKPGTLCVMLVPSRTDTAWFHDYVLGKAELRFVRGRLRFGGCPNPAPFPSLVAIYRRTNVG